MKLSKRLKIILSVLLIALVLAIIFIFSNYKGLINGQTSGKVGGKTFTGKITGIGHACDADAGQCSVAVDGKTVYLGGPRGFGPPPKTPTGSMIGFLRSDKEIGTTVEVFAQPFLDGSYTLEGNSDFYIKALR